MKKDDQHVPNGLSECGSPYFYVPWASEKGGEGEEKEAKEAKEENKVARRLMKRLHLLCSFSSPASDS
eukprot:scaffold1701_cov84-Skeletonema_dohrnii-CCMP3373.AAC.3